MTEKRFFDCPKCDKRIAEENLKEHLQNHSIKNTELSSKGKNTRFCNCEDQSPTHSSNGLIHFDEQCYHSDGTFHKIKK